jgi:flagellin-like protein
MAKKTAKRAVSPVLATLMMVAVAVALSVIIFTWSQSFLSQTGEAASGQQAAQNIAAQSGILIESVTFSGAGGGSPTATVYVRNVGTVSVIPALAVASGRPGQGFTAVTTAASITSDAATSSLGSMTLSKGAGAWIQFTLTDLKSGDVVSFKVTTTSGTFAQATYTVP